MKHIKKEFMLDCGPEEAWQLVVDRKKYEKWAAAFHAGSTYTGEMGLNETVNFVDSEGNGLVSKVVVFEPEKEIRFAFLGEINDGKYVEVAEFADMLEHYVFDPVGNQTKMLVDVAMDDRYYDMMNEMWDNAGIELVKLSNK
ncbi:activator of HSP90 ATPase [Listeria rocourtiae]|uniref:activator of HSP90 ATPase n=1 Tax=Listeria rocourtiae TaxID=647910 RepID=UPI001625B02D|nr:activator of HSP90 ATPase [Listeria rocourtiae]MBC1435042.1 activator of HSP90 ATPase [Listeria rocourtiae]